MHNRTPRWVPRKESVLQVEKSASVLQCNEGTTQQWKDFDQHRHGELNQLNKNIKEEKNKQSARINAIDLSIEE